MCLLNSTFTEFRKQSQQKIVYFPALQRFLLRNVIDI
ncbi:hypothetical protein VIBHAR_00938 [Vibrio campbellii ATCC BAA-1116]|uniref:Uncharacterized protein n=1 Tax=Vibrio campbellii (strain ATCC BAA-1116) TaxID=2902295 RepID=A7MXM9_VIBC1|nr:hypothetical protein VIBHAR_00938 [Vibrio campbellii ATCC BAA-1116]